jgi:hypothetical protein
MGPNSELLTLAQAIIESIQPNQEVEPQCTTSNPPYRNIFLTPRKVSDDVLLELSFIFPENLILAALDLIDRENGIKESDVHKSESFIFL